MSEFKQENGYNRAANVSAKPLSGAVPGTGRVMDWSKGDLKSLFLAPAAKEPVTPKATVTAAKLDTATPEKQTPQQDKPHAVKAEAATIDNDKQPEQGAVEAVEPKQETPKVKQPIVVPPQFAPVVAAGVLSSNQRAMAHAKPEDMEPESNFEFQLGKGGEAGRRARHQLAELERHIENDSGSDRNNAADLAEQYLAEQQQRAFMQSMEYAVALNTVNETMRYQEREIARLSSERDELLTRKNESDARLGVIGSEIQRKEERAGEIEDTITIKEEHDRNTEEYKTAEAEQEELQKQLRQLPTIKTFSGDKGDYYQTIENGEEVTYRIGADGNPQKISQEELESDATAICQRPMATYLKKMPDGSVEFIDDYGRKLSQDKIDKINQFMEKTEKTGADLGDMDDFEERKRAADKHLDEKVLPAGQKAADSQERLWNSLDKLKIPREDANNLYKYLQDEKEGVATLRAEYEKEKATNKLTTQQLAEKEAELKALEEDYKQSEKFKERLERGEFKSEAEMIKAMPESMKAAYESNRNDAKMQAQNKAAPVAQQTIPIDNTSRVNGSAAEPTVTASAKVGPPFAAAASGAPAAPAPEEPAPAPEMVAANQQQRNNLAGARLG